MLPITSEPDIRVGDCLDLLRAMPADSVDLVFTSPPYEDARAYGNLDFTLTGQDWVDWARERYLECVRVSRGLVCWVVAGRTRNYRWSATPALLMAALHERGLNLRNPAIFHRSGIPGSGGPDWLRSDYEWIVCASKPGRLPWSENTAMGQPPKWAPGGAMSHRLPSGAKVNGWEVTTTSGYKNGDTLTKRKHYTPPKKANPGNLIRCTVGGGHMGSKQAHKNVAPFPEKLAEFFVRSFCPPGGTVLDPFCGSGTTGAVAVTTGRKFVLMDLDPAMIELSRERIAESGAQQLLSI